MEFCNSKHVPSIWTCLSVSARLSTPQWNWIQAQMKSAVRDAALTPFKLVAGAQKPDSRHSIRVSQNQSNDKHLDTVWYRTWYKICFCLFTPSHSKCINKRFKSEYTRLDPILFVLSQTARSGKRNFYITHMIDSFNEYILQFLYRFQMFTILSH